MTAYYKVNTMNNNKLHRVNGWWLETDSILKSQWPRLEQLLENAEIERAERFHFEHDRQSYIAAHALTRALLTMETGLSPSSWRFTTGPFGKPEAILPPGLPKIRVNLSHTRGLAAAVLSIHHDVGVDVEWLGRNIDIKEFSTQVLTAQERAVLNATPQDQKRHVFLTFWTLKEAYIKAIGKGFSHPLDSFHFNLTPLGIHFKASRSAVSSDDAKQWKFQHFQPNLDHFMALAVHHPEPEKLAITFEAAPLETIIGLE